MPPACSLRMQRNRATPSLQETEPDGITRGRSGCAVVEGEGTGWTLWVLSTFVCEISGEGLRLPKASIPKRGVPPRHFLK